MAISNKELVDVLADLRETNIDLRKTYESAGENVENSNLRNKFNALGEKNQRFATELEREITNLGEKPGSDGSFKGTLQRGFMEIRSAFSKNDDEAMVEESIRAQKMALDNYDDVLNRDLPVNVQKIVSNQYGELKQQLTELQSFKGY